MEPLIVAAVAVAVPIGLYLAYRASLEEGAKMREQHAEVVRRRAVEDEERVAREQERQVMRAEAADAVIDAHVRTLARKRTQMLRTDDYGNRLSSGVEEWEVERRYFVEKVVQRDARDAVGTVAEVMQQIEDRVIEHIEETGDSRLYESDADLSGVEYEQYCARLLERSGWSVRLTAGSGDQGVDILAEREGRRVVVQCKMYSSPVGNKAVQEVVGARGLEKADVAAVVSNASYTPAAKQLAQANAVLLLHHSDLPELWTSISSGPTET